MFQSYHKDEGMHHYQHENSISWYMNTQFKKMFISDTWRKLPQRAKSLTKAHKAHFILTDVHA